LVKGGSYLEALGKLDIVVFDKTGTLTKGVFKVVASHAAYGFTQEELLKYAAYAEYFSSHPIAHSILQAYAQPVDSSRLTQYTELAGYGVRVNLDGKELLVGNDMLLQTASISFAKCSSMGTKVYVAINSQFVGCVVIADEIKEDSIKTIQGLKARGIYKIVMLTGDNAQAGQFIAKELALDEVYSELLPSYKVEKLEMLYAQKRPKGKLAFMGDGINDAPVLARADVGIAMGGMGADAAIEAADVIFMTDEPSKLLDAIDIAKVTKRIVWQNIIFALGVKGMFLLLSAFGIATMWEAVIADVGVSVITVLNAVRILKLR
jgi:Cd2+/Zn2+-exporting ATPase